MRSQHSGSCPAIIVCTCNREPATGCSTTDKERAGDFVATAVGKTKRCISSCTFGPTWRFGDQFPRVPRRTFEHNVAHLLVVYRALHDPES